MTKLISTLTPEQEAMLPVYLEKYRKMALNTEPMDKIKAKEVITRLYEINDLKTPLVVFASSPAESIKQINALKETKSKYNLDGLLQGFLEEEVKKVKNTNLEVPSMWFIGGSDFYWISLYKFGQYIGVKFDNLDKLDAYHDYAEHCGIMYAYEDIVFVSDRPEVIKFDEENLLHNEHGPSVKFRDGYSVYSWHGTRIPGKWIEEGITPQEALSQTNAELRRCACELIGWANVLEDESLNPVVIDKNEDPTIGTLVEVDLPEAPSQRFIKMQCGTGRWFAEPVEDKELFDTALKANAGGNGWRGQGDPLMYIPTIRT
jgi:hypothetical protein